MFAESSAWIAGPVIIALFLGRWLDEKQHSAPLFFLSLTALAFLVSSVGIGLAGVKYIKLIERDEKEKGKTAKNKPSFEIKQ
jgi:F0F1-type ATP synthase assembly protein I